MVECEQEIKDKEEGDLEGLSRHIYMSPGPVTWSSAQLDWKQGGLNHGWCGASCGVIQSIFTGTS